MRTLFRRLGAMPTRLRIVFREYADGAASGNSREAAAPARRLLVVCYGNLFRSALAAAVFRTRLPEGTWEVISAGTNAKEGREATDFARVVADEEGVDLSAHLSSPLTVEQVRLSDYIFTMSRQQAEKVAGLDPQAARRTRLLGAFATTPNTSSLPADPLHSPAEDDEVPDPIGEDLELHRESGRRIVTAVERAALWLRRGGLPAAAPPPAARWLKPRPAHAQVPVPAPRQAVGASSRRQG